MNSPANSQCASRPVTAGVAGSGRLLADRLGCDADSENVLPKGLILDDDDYDDEPCPPTLDDLCISVSPADEHTGRRRVTIEFNGEARTTDIFFDVRGRKLTRRLETFIATTAEELGIVGTWDKPNAKYRNPVIPAGMIWAIQEKAKQADLEAKVDGSIEIEAVTLARLAVANPARRYFCEGLLPEGQLTIIAAAEENVQNVVVPYAGRLLGDR